jgi:glycine betaine/proline transport system substrate-binding protein
MRLWKAAEASARTCFPASEKPVENSRATEYRVGHTFLSFHDTSTGAVDDILRKHGHAVERFPDPHDEMFQRLGCAEIDMRISAWLPASHGAYLAPIENQVRKVTVLYETY